MTVSYVLVVCWAALLVTCENMFFYTVLNLDETLNFWFVTETLYEEPSHPLPPNCTLMTYDVIDITRPLLFDSDTLQPLRLISVPTQC